MFLGCQSIIKTALQDANKAVTAINAIKSYVDNLGWEYDILKAAANPLLDKIKSYINTGKEALDIVEDICQVASFTPNHYSISYSCHRHHQTVKMGTNQDQEVRKQYLRYSVLYIEEWNSNF